MIWFTTVQNKQDDIYKDATKNTMGLFSKDTRDDFKYIKKNPRKQQKQNPNHKAMVSVPCNI